MRMEITFLKFSRSYSYYFGHEYVKICSKFICEQLGSVSTCLRPNYIKFFVIKIREMVENMRRSSAARSGDAIRVSAKDGESYVEISGTRTDRKEWLLQRYL